MFMGREIEGKIINFREVDYRDLSINFAMLFNPQFAKKYSTRIFGYCKI